MLEARITQVENGFIIDTRPPKFGGCGKQYVAADIPKLESLIGDLADEHKKVEGKDDATV